MSVAVKFSFGLLWLLRFLLGAAYFSFMNVVAHRLPRGQSSLTGRSACPQCGHTLAAADLVPLLSWLLLRGRCRTCRAKISLRYPAVELLGGVLALGCTRRFGTALALSQGLFGMSWAALAALALCGILLSIALIDAETQTIPNQLNGAVAAVGVVFTALAVVGAPARSAALLAEHALGAVCISVPMLLLCLAIPGAFGGGDIKLMAAAGLFLGGRLTLVAAFLAILGGGCWGAWLLAAKKAGGRDHFAFGPFLSAGIVLALLFGEALLDRYLQFFC